MRLLRGAGVLAVALAIGVGGAWTAEAADSPTRIRAPPLDYAAARNWICRPDKRSGCRDDLTTLVIAADGSTRVEPFAPAKDPKVDCFYVYPTVSHSPGVTALPMITGDERRAVRQQFERLATVCRLYAPFYRQTTATAMMQAMEGKAMSGTEATDLIPRTDVAAAWDTYLASYNKGRGVILVGHSQGAMILRELLRTRVDGKPLQARLISAILPGAFVVAPKGQDVGGTFQHIAACRSGDQVGCVIVFNAIRADHPIPADEVVHFDGADEPLCTNPAALAGGSGVLKPYFSSSGETIIPDLTEPQPAWTNPSIPVDKPFVATPELYSATCGAPDRGASLLVSSTPRPGDHRTGTLTGDWVFHGKVEQDMGLHLIDLNLTMGNLLDVLRSQIAAYERRSS